MLTDIFIKMHYYQRAPYVEDWLRKDIAGSIRLALFAPDLCYQMPDASYPSRRWRDLEARRYVLSFPLEVLPIGTVPKRDDEDSRGEFNPIQLVNYEPVKINIK